MTITWNPLDKNAVITLSGSDLIATSTSASYGSVRAKFGYSTGKIYWEVVTGWCGFVFVGVGSSTDALNYYPGYNSTGYGYYSSTGVKINNNSLTAYGNTFTEGDVIGVALDLDNGKIWFSKNGTWQNSGDPAAGTGEAFSGLTGTKYPMLGLRTTPSAGTLVAASADFTYSAPSGFSAIGDIPEPDGDPTNLGVLLIHSDTTDGSTTFTDSSPSGHTITATGTAQHSTASAVFGASSISTSGGQLVLTDDADWNLGAGDFTFDFRIKPASTGRQFVCGQMNSAAASTTANLLFEIQNGGNLQIQQGITTGAGYFVWSPGITLNDITNYHHLALVRNGDVLTCYYDGTAGATTYDVTGLTFTDQTTQFSFGQAGEFASLRFGGNFDEIRLVKGSAIWTSNFTPPTAPYGAATTYTVTYDGNTNTSGAVPTDTTAYSTGDTVTVLGNTGSLAKTGYVFNGWNTAADGSGTSYAASATFLMGSANVTLYAVWVAPTLSTAAATNLTLSSATLNGALDDMGAELSLDLSFQYGTTTSYGSETPTTTLTAPGNISANISDLDPDTTYHFRLKATNGTDTWYSADATFETYLAKIYVDGVWKYSRNAWKAVDGVWTPVVSITKTGDTWNFNIE